MAHARRAARSGNDSLPAQPAADDKEPEEPDFAFIAGGPYTQKKNSIQFIFPSQWGRRTSTLSGATLQHAEFGTLLRMEWGLTDRWELDLIMSAEGEQHVLGGRRLDSYISWADTVLGVRYRLLDESFAPFTLALGPQFIIPTGNLLRSTGFDTVGYAWDVAAAKDWGGPVFLYTSLNYAFFPSVRDPIPTSDRKFGLHSLFWGSALALRALEKPRGASHHDVHIFLEYGLGREGRLDLNGTTRKASEIVTLVAPGIRYGFLSPNESLFEIGVSFPVGLNRSTPHHGVIIQFQFERFLRRLGR